MALLNMIIMIDKVTQWSICNRYFIYRPEGDDEDNEHFHIVDLENKNATYLVQDFASI